MISTLSPLLEHPEAALHNTGAPRNSRGIEDALFHARGALLSGWQLSPEEALAYTGGASCHGHAGDGPHAGERPDEDEVDETALYFGE